ncbi:MAG: hypothetical protein M3463_11040 [Verrucomicrobiota bacterium]|nr:hypothetical protein [Verrucomicrobiota bacterium]
MEKLYTVLGTGARTLLCIHARAARQNDGAAACHAARHPQRCIIAG